MAKGKQGFASNPDNINKGGRPKGSKSRNTLKDAIKRFEANQIGAANIIIQIMNGNEAFFDGKEIKPMDRFSAARYVITAPEQMRKGVDDDASEEQDDDSKSEDSVVKPLVQLNVVSK